MHSGRGKGNTIHEKTAVSGGKGDDWMADSKRFTKEMQNYYDTLPAFLQESISQSTSSFNDLQSLRAFAERVRKEKEEK